MKDRLSICCTPYSEQCEQLGRDYRQEIARAECRAFINQIRRVCGEPPIWASFRVSSNPHDFGTYYDVEVVFDDNNEEAVNYAYGVEDADLEYWDDEAREELLLVPGYPIYRILKEDANLDSCSHSDTV